MNQNNPAAYGCFGPPLPDPAGDRKTVDVAILRRGDAYGPR
jgi:hypothetical protein